MQRMSEESLDRLGGKEDEANHSLCVDSGVDSDVSDDEVDNKKGKKSNRKKPSAFSITGKQLVGCFMLMLLFAVLWDSTMTPQEKRFLRPDLSKDFLRWVQIHPYNGVGAFLVVLAVSVVLMIPVGTPLTLGCGYVYKGAYGWYLGVPVATAVAMAGSALGAVCCFLLGRYLMRDRVKKWSCNYPLFDAINIAVSENGFKIMAMLYLTPILPLGPVSYMCGTTGMRLSSFALAKIAATPLMMLYVFIGASCGTLLSDGKGGNAAEEAKQLENNRSMIIFGIVLSTFTIGIISRHIKKELYKIFERQKLEGAKGYNKTEDKEKQQDISEPETEEGGALEMGINIKKEAFHRRHRAISGP